MNTPYSPSNTTSQVAPNRPGRRSLVIALITLGAVLFISFASAVVFVLADLDIIVFLMVQTVATCLIAGIGSGLGLMAAFSKQDGPIRFTPSLVFGLLLNGLLMLYVVWVMFGFLVALLG